MLRNQNELYAIVVANYKDVLIVPNFEITEYSSNSICNMINELLAEV